MTPRRCTSACHAASVSVPGVSQLESDRELHEILARSTGAMDPDELVDALFDDLKGHHDAGAAEPGRGPGDRAEVAIVLDRDLISVGQRRGEKRRIAEHRPQHRAGDGHRGLAANDHRERTCTPRGPAWAALRSRSYTRSALLWVSNTMCAPSGSASAIALQIVESGAPPPSPMPLAPLGVNGDGTLDVPGADVRDIERGRGVIVHERRLQQLAVIVVVERLVQRRADPVAGRAVDLALDDLRVDLAPALVDGGVVENARPARSPRRARSRRHGPGSRR